MHEHSKSNNSVRVEGHSVVIDCASTQDVRQVLEMANKRPPNKRREGAKEEWTRDKRMKFEAAERPVNSRSAVPLLTQSNDGDHQNTVCWF